MIQRRLLEFRKIWSEQQVNNFPKYIGNIDRAVLFQNFPRADQFKHNCLGCAMDYIWESTKSRQKAISRLRVHWPTWVLYLWSDIQQDFPCPTCILLLYNKLNMYVCHRSHKIMCDDNPGNKMHLRLEAFCLLSWSLSHSSSRHCSLRIGVTLVILFGHPGCCWH